LHLLEVGWGYVEWIGVAQDMESLTELVNAVTNLHFGNESDENVNLDAKTLLNVWYRKEGCGIQADRSYLAAAKTE
jgi:hypothetical protein